MDTIGVEEIGLLDTQVVAFPVDLFQGNRAQLVLTQDSGGAAPAEGLTLEDVGLQYVIPIQIIQDFNQPVGTSSENTFLIDSTQLAYLTANGQMMIEASNGSCTQADTAAATACDLLNAATSDIMKTSSITLTDSSNSLITSLPASMNCSLTLNNLGNCELLIESADLGSGQAEPTSAVHESALSGESEAGCDTINKENGCKFIQEQTDGDGGQGGKSLPRIWTVDVSVSPPHKKGPFRCEVCTNSFDTWPAYKKHLKTHLDDKPHRCPHCPATFNVPANLVLHKATHDSNKLQCPECNKKFNRLASLKFHLQLHEHEESLFCKECGDEFNNQTQLDEHVREHDEEWVRPEIKVYKCTQCDRQYGRMSFLREHMKSHKKVKVSLSSKSQKRALRRGVLLHNCNTCQKSFQKPSQLLRHMRIHTGEKPWKCDICSKAFNQKGSLQIHMLKHNGFRPYQCEFCNAKFSQKGNLRAHIVRLHTVPRSEEVFFECPCCTCVFRKLSRLNAHMNRMHRTEVDFVWKNSVNYSQKNGEIDLLALKDSSDKENEGGQPTMGKSIRRNVCSYCSKEFKKPSDLVRHVRIHTHEKPFQCAYCRRTFTVRSTLTTHMRIHTGDKNYVCVECNKLFASSSSLRVHSKSHYREKRYASSAGNEAIVLKAEIENKSSLHEVATDSNNEQLQSGASCGAEPGDSAAKMDEIAGNENREEESSAVAVADAVDADQPPPVSSSHHQTQTTIQLQEPYMVTETGDVVQVHARNFPVDDGADRPHKCTTCGTAFKKSSHLKMHTRVHTGERPYSCHICHRTFVSLGILKGHIRSHTGVKSHKCNDCGKMFATRSTMRRHMETHVLGKPFICPYCSKSYKSKATCKSHIRIHSQMVQQQSLEDVQQEDHEHQQLVELQTVDQDEHHGHQQVHEVVLDRDHHHQLQTEEEMVQQVIADQESEAAAVELAQEVLDSHQVVHVERIGDANGTGMESSVPAVEALLINPGSFQITDEMAEEIGVTEVAQTLQADASGTIMISSLNGPEALSQESIREIEETLNQQLFGSLTADKEQAVVNTSALFDQSFDHCVFSAITLPVSEQLGLEQVLPTTTNLEHMDKELQENSLQEHVDRLGKEGDDCIEKDGDLVDQSELITIAAAADERQNQFVNNKADLDLPLMCTICEKTFTTVAQLKMHERNHGREKVHECHLCGSAYTTAASLLRHMSIHADKKLFTCLICGQSCRTGSQLRRHCNKHKQHNGGSGASGGGGNGRRNVKRKRGEARQLTEEETNQLVGQLPENGTSVSEKVLIASVQERDKISELKDPADKFISEPAFANRCKYCPKSFRKPSDLTRHLRTHTGERPFQCQRCFKSFTVKSTLDSHMKTHGSCKQFTCHVCVHQFATKGSLKVHMRLHTGSRPFRCPICDQRFRTSGHRKAHLMSHVREAGLKEITDMDALQQLPCCKKHVQQPGHDHASDHLHHHNQQEVGEEDEELLLGGVEEDLHERGVEKVQRVVEQEVGDQMIEIITSDDQGVGGDDEEVVDGQTAADNLLDIFNPVTLNAEENGSVHQVEVVAVDEVKVRRKQVGNGGSRNKSQQQQQSSGWKNGCLCPVCGNIFVKKSCLVRHMRIHTGERPYNCELCGKSFNQKSTLMMHVQRHSGLRPWQCPDCDAEFTQKGNLKTHMKRIHQFSPHTKALTSTGTRKKVPSFSIELPTSVIPEKILDYENVIGDLFSSSVSEVTAVTE